MGKIRRKRSNAEKRAIRKYYAEQSNAGKDRHGNVGKVYRGETKYIDKEPKKQRDYVVVRVSERGVSVAKLKSIKKFDDTGKNADPALVEINHARYGLPNRTGVDFQRFDSNRMSGKPLRLDDKSVFPGDNERFKLSNRDTEKILLHTGVKKPNRRKKRE